MSNYHINFLFHYQPAVTPPPSCSVTANRLSLLSIFANHTTNLPTEKPMQVLTCNQEQLIGQAPLPKGFPQKTLLHLSPEAFITHFPTGELCTPSDQRSVAGGSSKGAQREAEGFFSVLSAEVLFFQVQLTMLSPGMEGPRQCILNAAALVIYCCSGEYLET